MAEMVFIRKCNGCTACCKTHRVDEVHTRAGEWCRQCNIGKGCSIYEQRPLGCRTYSCVWLQGKGGEEDRPDRFGVVMDYLGIKFGDEEIPIFSFWEVEENAIDRPRVQQIMVANVEVGNIVVYRKLGGEPTYYFPKGMFSPEKQRRFIEVAEHS